MSVGWGDTEERGGEGESQELESEKGNVGTCTGMTQIRSKGEERGIRRDKATVKGRRKMRGIDRTQKTKMQENRKK